MRKLKKQFTFTALKGFKKIMLQCKNTDEMQQNFCCVFYIAAITLWDLNLEPKLSMCP